MPLMDEFLAGKLHMAIVTNELVAVDEALRDNLVSPQMAFVSLHSFRICYVSSALVLTLCRVCCRIYLIPRTFLV